MLREESRAPVHYANTERTQFFSSADCWRLPIERKAYAVCRARYFKWYKFKAFHVAIGQQLTRSHSRGAVARWPRSHNMNSNILHFCQALNYILIMLWCGRICFMYEGISILRAFCRQQWPTTVPFAKVVSMFFASCAECFKASFWMHARTTVVLVASTGQHISQLPGFGMSSSNVSPLAETEFATHAFHITLSYSNEHVNRTNTPSESIEENVVSVRCEERGCRKKELERSTRTFCCIRRTHWPFVNAQNEWWI